MAQLAQLHSKRGSVPRVPRVPPTEEREMTVKRKERTAECPVDSQGVSARREFTE